MAKTGLRKTLVPLPMDKGLDTKLDSKQELPGFLRKAENVVYETIFKLRKRNGYDALPSTGLDETPIVSTKYKNELLALTKSGLYSFSDVLQKWSKKGTLYPTSITTTPIIKNANSQTQVDSTIVENIRTTVWKDSDGTIKYSVQDLTTKSFIVSNQTVATGERPVLGTIANVVHIFYGTGADISFKRFSIVTPEILSTATVVASDRSTTAGLIDAVTSSNKIFVAYNSATNLKLFSVVDGAVVSSVLGLTSQNATTSLNLLADSSNRVLLQFANGTQTKAAVYSYNLSPLLAPTLVDTAEVSNATAVQTDAGYTLYYEVVQTGISNNYVKSATLTLSGTVGTPQVFKRSVGLASNAFTYASSAYVPVVYESEQQSTFYILDSLGMQVSKFANQGAGGVILDGVLPTTSVVADLVHIPGLFRNRIQQEDDVETERTFFSTTGALVATLNFAPETPYSNAELAEGLHIAAGALKLYDGSTVTEHGFNAFPEVLSRSTTSVPTYVLVEVEGVTSTTSEVQTVYFQTVPTAGTWKLNIEGAFTDALAYNISAADLQTAVNALSPITSATVTGSNSLGYKITITSPQRDFATFTVTDSSLTTTALYSTAVPVSPTTITEGGVGISEVQKLQYDAVPTGGYMQITIGSETTDRLYHNVANAEIKRQLDAFSAIISCTVTGDFSVGHTITITSPQADFAQATVVSNFVKHHDTVNTTTVSGTVTTTTPGSVGVSEVQRIDFSEAPDMGHFTLDFNGNSTANLFYNSTAADIKAALENVSGITTVTVAGSMPSFRVTFDNPTGNVAQLVVASSLLKFGEGGLSNGNYGYKAAYRWTDNTGRDHFSAPTFTDLNVVLAGGSDTQSVTLIVPTLRLTEKQNVVIDIYRSEDAGVSYYKITDTLNPLKNDPTVDTLTFVDTITNAALISRELLYTTGGVLENIAFGPVRQVTAHKGERLAVIEDDSFRVRWSKIMQEQGPVEPTDFIYRDFDPSGGPLTAIKEMGERLIVFSAGSCFFISGDGPTNTGSSDTFTKPDLITTDLGCVSAPSIALLTSGLIFKSLKGIWRLGPGDAMEYVGAAVEAYNGQSVTSAQVVGALNQVRFVLSESRALVYNYNLDRWATFENHGGLSSIAIENDYFYVREDGSFYKENRSSFSDAGSPIKLKIQTGWLSFVTLQGYQRAYRALLLADYKSSHKLLLKAAYDFKEAWVDEVLINPLDFLSGATYGSVSPYGSESPYGGDGNLYQARIDFAQQKCESMSLSIEDVQAEAGEGLSLSAVSILVGAKEGTNKLGSGSQFGTE